MIFDRRFFIQFNNISHYLQFKKGRSEKKHEPNFFKILIFRHFLFLDPFLLMAKQMTDTNPDLWQKATSVKRPPILLSTNSQLIEEKLELIKEMHKNQRNETITLIEDLSPPVLRSFLRDLLMLIREKTITDCAVQLQISNKSKESNRMQEIRRSAERTRDRIMVCIFIICMDYCF